MTTVAETAYRSPASDLRLAATGIRKDPKLATIAGSEFATGLADLLDLRASEYEGVQGGYAEFLAHSRRHEDPALVVARAYLDFD
jgi:hypothetical protein